MPEPNDFLHLLPMLKGIPAACLLALVLAGPLDLGGLTLATGYTRGRVAEALRTLETLGLVFAGAGMWAVNRKKLDFYSPDRRVSESQSQESLILESQRLQTQDSETRDSIQMTQDSETQDSETQEAVLVEKILALTGELFQEPVLLPPGLQVTSHELLVQVAEAFINRQRLRFPARVVASNLKHGRPASRRFMANPRAYLPAGFLRRVDEAIAACQAESDLEDDGEALETGQRMSSGKFIPDPEQSESARLWEAARDELERSLPKASYESYVRPLAAVDYDAEEGQLFLEAPDGQSCAWLDSHLKRILERLMVGITGETVRVVFVPPVEAEAGGEV